ncbi:uncharacterized protein LOC110452352 [Mizuhopecten yessoensis]|uniref:Uncharacterized protein n=1 Tax=Mizuhopecten yessoensis TaxID=6573 RepID=A0A210QJS0_MIZYE|nr:uncharacterized protein LOC110452352 [Mizuhopecten yessoensis]OWF49004.1 hypothetical protein KP79_PYT06959 [Mizuhopecten yessoensis]
MRNMMGKCTVCSVVSFLVSSSIICGGTTVCILIEYVSQGPLFQDPAIKGLIMVFSGVSFMSTGFAGLLALRHNDSTWVTNLQISIESIMMIATLTAFLALKDTVYLPEYDDCVPSNITSVCTCSERDVINLPESITSAVDCSTLYSALDTAHALIYLYLAIWMLCIIELFRAVFRACTRSSRRQENESEDMLNNSTFYNIPYPEITHKKKKKTENKQDVDKEKIFTLLNA